MSTGVKIGQRIVGLVGGLLFGSGMLVSGMANPHKVLAFLDVTRAWDPSLAFVMASALAIAFPVFAYVRRHPRTLIGQQPIVLPARSPLTPQLIIGAVLFGLGWGLSGLCPGPVLVVAGGGSIGAIAFVLTMAIGMRIASRYSARLFPAKAVAVPVDGSDSR